MPTLVPKTFEAWIDTMPVSPHKLIVTGKAEVPTPGWTSSLCPAVPQGINPDILLLDLTLTPPSGNVEQLVSEVDCRYEQTPLKHRYTEVTVRYEKQDVTVKVKTTS